MTTPAITPIKKLVSAVSPAIPFECRTESGDLREFKLRLDFNAICKVKTEIGLDLVDPEAWRNLDNSQLSVIFWATFDTEHPEVTLREARSWLAPLQKGDLFIMLIEQCFPGSVARISEQLAKKNEGTAGEPEPTPQATG